MATLSLLALYIYIYLNPVPAKLHACKFMLSLSQLINSNVIIYLSVIQIVKYMVWYCRVADPSQRENLGIIVQYKVKVKLCLGALGG